MKEKGIYPRKQYRADKRVYQVIYHFASAEGFIILTKQNRIIAIEQLFQCFVLFLFTLFQIICCVAIAYFNQTTAYLAWGVGVCVQIIAFGLFFVFKFSLYMLRPHGTTISLERENYTLARNPEVGDITETTL